MFIVSRVLAVLVIDVSDALAKFGNNMFAHVDEIHGKMAMYFFILLPFYKV